MIILKEFVDDNKKYKLVKRLQEITFNFEGSELFDELRVFIDEKIDNNSLKEILNILVDESESDNEDSEMVLNVLESELDSFYRY